MHSQCVVRGRQGHQSSDDNHPTNKCAVPFGGVANGRSLSSAGQIPLVQNSALRDPWAPCYILTDEGDH